MPRPSRNADRLLLDAGKELLHRQGASGLSVRGVARKAGVNLGLFHYHFRSRERFLSVLLQEIYEDLFARLSLPFETVRDPLRRLERMLEALGRFLRDHRSLVLSLMADAARGDRTVLGFMADNFPRHMGLLKRAVEEGRRRGRIRKIPVFTALSFVAGAVLWPCLFGEILSRSPRLTRRLLARAVVRREILSDAAVAERARLAARALAAGEAP